MSHNEVSTSKNPLNLRARRFAEFYTSALVHQEYADRQRGDILVFAAVPVAVVLSNNRQIWRISDTRFSEKESKTTRTFARHGQMLRPHPAALATSIATYFEKAITKPQHLESGFNALEWANLEFFMEGGVFPDTDSLLSPMQFERSWKILAESIRPLDLVFTRTIGDTLSRVIAKLDGGSWSHVAVYLHDGYLGESVTTGTRVIHLSHYKQERIRIGVYRGLEPVNEEGLKNLCGNFPITSRYSYLGAVGAGFRNLFRLKSRREYPTPNCILRTGFYYAVSIV